MSAAPKRRAAPPEQEVHIDDPVKIERTDGDSQLGIVRDVTHNGHQKRAIVGTKDGQLIDTAASRVEVATGTHADLVHDLVGGGDSD